VRTLGRRGSALRRHRRFRKGSELRVLEEDIKVGHGEASFQLFQIVHRFLQKTVATVATIAYNTNRKNAVGEREGLLTSMLVMW